MLGVVYDDHCPAMSQWICAGDGILGWRWRWLRETDRVGRRLEIPLTEQRFARCGGIIPIDHQRASRSSEAVLVRASSDIMHRSFTRKVEWKHQISPLDLLCLQQILLFPSDPTPINDITLPSDSSAIVRCKEQSQPCHISWV